MPEPTDQIGGVRFIARFRCFSHRGVSLGLTLSKVALLGNFNVSFADSQRVLEQ